MTTLGPGAAVMVKAIAGGGGRGMRAVNDPAQLATAMERCASEAKAAFGNGDLYVERLLAHARHIEVQVVGDGETVSHLWDRECSLQRQRQNLNWRSILGGCAARKARVVHLGSVDMAIIALLHYVSRSQESLKGLFVQNRGAGRNAWNELHAYECLKYRYRRWNSAK